MPFSCFPTSFTVFERPFLFSNVLFLFSNILSSFRIAYSVVNRYVTTYINLIRLLTWGATNQDMSLFMKSRLGGCYKTRHVTKRDVLVLATLRYFKHISIQRKNLEFRYDFIGLSIHCVLGVMAKRGGSKTRKSQGSLFDDKA